MIIGRKADLIKSNLIQFLLLLSIVGTLILPSIELSTNIPKIEISDITFLLLLFLAIFDFKQNITNYLLRDKLFLIFCGSFSILIIISIFINLRYSNYRDWFELLKFIKFVFFVFCFYTYLNFSLLYRFLKILFSVVFIFNIFHYFNILDFNVYISPYFTSGQHLKYFGIDTIGQIATKRAYGTMGNCNNNAFYFITFLLLFIDQYLKTKSKSDLFFLVLALTGIFMSQSRIVFLTLVVLLIFSVIYLKSSRKFFLGLIALTLLFYLIFYISGNIYLASVQHIDVLADASVGRTDQWMKIIHSMPGFWVFGHAPNKEYFEIHQIYAESEYFLVLFRYGILGLLLFLGILAFGMVRFLKVFKTSFFPFAFLLTYSVNCITNAPFYGIKSLIQFAFFYAIILFILDARKIEK